MNNILEADSVILEFDNCWVLYDVYVKCQQGEVVGLLGRNGTGKSCLMKIILGELSCQGKSIRINKEALITDKRSHRDMMYLPQNEFIPKQFKISKVLRHFDLDFNYLVECFPEYEKYYNTPLKELSGGECRIFEIFTVLASSTKFCLLDEPFSQIMPIHVEKIKQLIRKEKANKGIIITDHLYEHIIEICDDIYIIYEGKTYLMSDVSDIETLGYARMRN
ncbi:ATP-binding cassette domain-containing protein [Prolixibacteraceae bacterium JC049]|nr:ATP-binding cassette domain-containing protein [Prolixibacteraceae bacterium JC049]